MTIPVPMKTQQLALIRPLFGPDAAVAVCDPDAKPPAPLPEEAVGLSATAVDKRRREFAAGRSAARQAMAQLGMASQAIPIGPNRAPVWPNGVTGSISHTRGCAAAVATRSGEDILALGIDLEADTPLREKLLPSVCTDAERDWLQRQCDAGQMAKVIFSAKEAAYKCQYVLSGQYFGFGGMELEVDITENRFRAQFTADQPPFAKGQHILGRFAIGAGYIITAAELRPTE